MSAPTDKQASLDEETDQHKLLDKEMAIASEIKATVLKLASQMAMADSQYGMRVEFLIDRMDTGKIGLKMPLRIWKPL